MYSLATRQALRATRRPITQIVRPRYQTTASTSSGAAGDPVEREAGREALKAGAKRDPELMILLAIMCGAFGMVGWHFSRNPTSSGSENHVAKAANSEPWKTGRSAVYMYHPGGDTSQPPKEAPSALNTVIIPNVNLPKSLHEQYNKYGKEGY